MNSSEISLHWIFILFVSELYLSQACPFGTFGIDCMYRCHCLDSADCDDTSGRCTTGCAGGWDGPSCQRENVAYGRTTMQKEGSSSVNSSYAVDDSIHTCSASKSNVPGWWALTLDHVISVRSIILKADQSSDIQGWKIYVGNYDNLLSMNLCTTLRVSGTGTTAFCDSTLEGKYVRVVNRKGSVNICDIQLKVCSKYWFGDECEKTCNCADQGEVCDSSSGDCKTGCSPGWTEPGCQTACISRYGQDCKFYCGHCADNMSCNHVTGTCPKGCEAGWTGMFCTSKCLDDQHGKNCNMTCGHCYGVDSCDVRTGVCRHGCEPGYMGNLCVDECPPGFYGRNCSVMCGHCLDETICDNKIGICPNGCSPGWQGVFCTQACGAGFYGLGCQSVCKNCYLSKCNPKDGTCINGCSEGFIGKRCDIECPKGSYGKNCDESCGNCMNGANCDSITGHCTTDCEIGYQKPKCTKLCREGYYGMNCTKCGVCAAGTTCDPFTGLCPNGCGFQFFGDKCMQIEPFTDEDGPQLAIFLGFMITTVTVIMVAVVVCLVLIWRREHLLDMSEESDPINEKENAGKLSAQCDDGEQSETTVFL